MPEDKKGRRILKKRHIKKETVRPESRAESEYYRLYSSGKGLKKYPTPPMSGSGYLGEHPRLGEYFTHKRKGEKPPKDMINPVFKENYMYDEGSKEGYKVKAQKGTGRLYPDISAEFPKVETEGEKHWNIKRFAYAPFYGKSRGSGYHYSTGNVNKEGYMPEKTGEVPLNIPKGDKARGRHLLQDIYKYNLADTDKSRGEAWRESKRFIRKEIRPLVKSRYHKLTESGDVTASVDSDSVDTQLLDSSYRALEDYNRRFRRFSRKDAKKQARSYKKR